MTPEAAYEYALRNAPVNADGSIAEKALADLVAGLVDIDEQKARADIARRIIKRKKQPGSTGADGQLVLPGMEIYAWEPDRLIADDEGNVQLNKECRPHFKVAEARRATRNLTRVAAWAARKNEESNRYGEWAFDQLSHGRSAADITFGVFVREAGLWQSGEAAPEQGPEPEIGD